MYRPLLVGALLLTVGACSASSPALGPTDAPAPPTATPFESPRVSEVPIIVETPAPSESTVASPEPLPSELTPDPVSGLVLLAPLAGVTVGEMARDATGEAEVSLTWQAGSPCHETTEPVVSVEGAVIAITLIDGVVPDRICAAVVVDAGRVVPLGKIPAGTYTIHVNDDPAVERTLR